MGFMVQKIWEKFSVYANFENFTDRRQTRFDTIYTGSVTNPVFRDIYAPLDGFVANFGVMAYRCLVFIYSILFVITADWQDRN